jgi:hypothetical protein
LSEEDVVAPAMEDVKTGERALAVKGPGGKSVYYYLGPVRPGNPDEVIALSFIRPEYIVGAIIQRWPGLAAKQGGRTKRKKLGSRKKRV